MFLLSWVTFSDGHSQELEASLSRTVEGLQRLKRDVDEDASRFAKEQEQYKQLTGQLELYKQKAVELEEQMKERLPALLKSEAAYADDLKRIEKVALLVLVPASVIEAKKGLEGAMKRYVAAANELACGFDELKKVEQEVLV